VRERALAVRVARSAGVIVSEHCRLRCALRSLVFDELFPYLSDYRRQYMSEAGIRLNGMAHAYPRGVVAPAPSRYSKLCEQVLGVLGLGESEPRS
jgi:hypothetical protein